jgi:hypothetical protein
MKKKIEKQKLEHLGHAEYVDCLVPRHLHWTVLGLQHHARACPAHHGFQLQAAQPLHYFAYFFVRQLVNVDFHFGHLFISAAAHFPPIWALESAACRTRGSKAAPFLLYILRQAAACQWKN